MTKPSVRVERAAFWASQPRSSQNPNGDEAKYADRRASFTKGFEHNSSGLIARPADFDRLANALASANPSDFGALPLSGEARLTSPQAGLGLELIGPDPRHMSLPAAPAFESAAIAAEIAENYAMALLRDLPFGRYAEPSSLMNQVCAGLSALSDFAGPTQAGKVTPATLFRGLDRTDGAGHLVGPYLSQFMWLKVLFGGQVIDQQMRTVPHGVDYMQSWGDWLAVQNGAPPQVSPARAQRYIVNGRDLAEWVHVDQLYQAYFNACLILLEYKRDGAPAFDKNNPYGRLPASKTQGAFATFGGPHILSLMTEVATRALKAVWFQKWAVHRRLRPEVLAARVDRQKAGADFGIHADIMGSPLLDLVRHRNGGQGYLLPMAFPEGSPMHPAYGAGHATVAGACVTILKAWFDEDACLADLTDPFTGAKLAPKVPSADGLSLVPLEGADARRLTIGGELNKLAANISIGRNFAGVHYRSDHAASIRLGEQIAIATLADYFASYNEPFEGFSLTRFDGSRIQVTDTSWP